MADDNKTGHAAYRIADRLLRPAELAGAVIGAGMMMAAMVLNALDALLRYGINKPLNFNLFVTENYLMVGLICMPMAWAFRTGGYIRITFLFQAFPRRIGNGMLRVGLLVSAYYCARLTWTSFLNWYERYETNARQLGIVDWPWHWSWIWIPLGMGLLTLRLILSAVGPAADLTAAHAPEEDAV